MNRDRKILTGAEMRASEQRAIAAGASEAGLMQAAGTGAADLIAPLVEGRPVLILCGSGNNGGDGYVAAEALRRAGAEVTVAAFAVPGKEPASMAAQAWRGKTQAPQSAKPAAVFVDALFGTGLTRPVGDPYHAELMRLADAAEMRIALDMPSGIDADHGACLSDVARFDRTMAFGALKPSHLLYPAAAFCGQIEVVPLDIDTAAAAAFVLTAPERLESDPAAHKYQRGSVAIAAGAMPGAAWLAARAAQRAGAGFVTVAGNIHAFPPSSLVMRDIGDLKAQRIDAAVVGPGLGQGDDARQAAISFLDLDIPLVIDGDMFSLFSEEHVRLAGRGDIMTPHEGEFVRFFGEVPGSKVDRARAAAMKSGNVIVLKGADTVVASPDGEVAVNEHAHPRLAVAGSGDILAGAIAAERARGRPAFEAACAGVWRHGDAGIRGRDGLIAEDLLELIRQ
ncbi:NAD(P)H-hydrate dehydratase [Pacificimonas sp. WHA3]|uniref:Bifunctional NAD(P)H-hydrate repair enzyme n=1 Tax=Pacificimonas pallii TaxID=2827236 RepID=A0ABS6SDS2_9SPHN|nr:NAD(P)H-hydrate dehydratase [Pacificimonas pallii]MBV7256569.1 NAD(P)H-hydrate dehydratase [Pacificimonas pallii]